MTRLDHHRAMGQIANKAQVGVKEVTNVIIWGNHSSTQYNLTRLGPDPGRFPYVVASNKVRPSVSKKAKYCEVV